MVERSSVEKEIAQRWLRTKFQIRVSAEAPQVEAVLKNATEAMSTILSPKQRKRFDDVLHKLIEELHRELEKTVSDVGIIGPSTTTIKHSNEPAMRMEELSEATTNENLEEFQARAESKFTFMSLADYLNKTAPGELPESPMLGANLRVLQEAESKGISSTTICLPKNVQISSVAGYLPQRHFDPKIGRLNDEGIAVNVDLFRLYYMLSRCPEARIHHEGMPFDLENIFQFQQTAEKNVFIPDTAVMLFSDRGQKMLFDDPALLLNTIRKRNKTSKGGEFHHIHWHRPGEKVYGDQSAQSHEQTCDEAGEWFRYEKIAGAYDSALNQISHGAQFCVSKNEPREIYIPKLGMDFSVHGINPTTAYMYDLRTMIEYLENYQRSVAKFAVMNRKREQAVLHRMKGAVPEGYECDTVTIPHVIYGVSHKHEIMNNAANNGVALLLTTPHSLRDFKEEEGRFYADKRNRIYHVIINDILPILKQALGMQSS